MKRNLFIATDVGNGITCIEDAANVFMYLIQGTERVLLFDTGSGIGNVAEFVSTLTDLPIYVVVSHGHVDHASGSYDFEEVYLSEKDRDIFPELTKVELRMEFAEKAASMAAEQGRPTADWGKSDFTPPGPVKLQILENGMEFNLGGRILRAVSVPGHTPGFTAVFDEMTQSLFAGDCGNPSTFMFLKECTSLEEYYHALLHLKEEYGGRIKHWILSHMMMEVPVGILDELIECCETVFEGKASGQNFVFDFADMGSEDAYFVYPAGVNQLRQDGHLGNIIYSTKKRWKEGRDENKSGIYGKN
ncbi:MAG: MBL fold metallo-hydrolase [Hespellia sp.]|nr:MBL fold metallo-hydrolase [Hespellia sp.]